MTWSDSQLLEVDLFAAATYAPPLPASADELAAMPYHDYLQTPEWRDRRRQAISAAGHCCERCGIYDVPLDVHHLTYARRGNEHPDDLMVLCRPCHSSAHGLE
jgi:hypothetical protein